MVSLHCEFSYAHARAFSCTKALPYWLHDVVFPIVYVHIRFKMTFPCRGFVTLPALVWFFPNVCAHMVLRWLFCAKTLPPSLQRCVLSIVYIYVSCMIIFLCSKALNILSYMVSPFISISLKTLVLVSPLSYSVHSLNFGIIPFSITTARSSC